MGLKIMQKHIDLVKQLAKPGADIAAQLTPGAAHDLHMSSCLQGEVAELIDAIYGDDGSVLEELGDVEFYLKGLIYAPDRPPLQIVRSDSMAYRHFSGTHLTNLLVKSAGIVFDTFKRPAFYGTKFDPVISSVHVQDFADVMARIYHECGFSIEAAENHNIRKLGLRYHSGEFSNKQAQERADKNLERN